MKAKKAIALAGDVADLLPEKLREIDDLNGRSTMYGAGFVTAISIIKSLMERDDDDVTPDNLADVVVAGCIVTARFDDIIGIIEKEVGNED